MAEAVIGLALGVFPLLLAAPQQYSKAAAAFSRYHYFGAEFADLATTLKIQRTIFNLANRSLLRLCVAQDEAVRMLADAQHPSWKDAAVECWFVDRLGDCRPEVFAAIELINKELGKLEKECSEHSRGVREQAVPELGNDSSSLSPNPQFRTAINRVRDLTQDYNTLISRTCSDQTRQPEPACYAVLKSKKISQFAQVKEVAENLYNALGSACTKHTEHQAHFSVQPGWSSPKAHISFRIAFRQPILSRVLCQEQLIWIIVESSVTRGPSNASSTKVEALTELNEALRRRPPLPTRQTPRKRLKKAVRFQSPDPPSPPSAPFMPRETHLQNLSTQNNLCNQLQKSRAGAKSDCCVGVLHHSPESKHLVYLDRQRMLLPDGVHGNALMSLHELLIKLKQDRELMTTLTRLERIRFAKKLATAVLQLHETPWLKSSWRSDDVFLSGLSTKGGKTLSDLKEPFFSVAVRQLPGPLSPSPILPNRTLIRNPVLFGLGVIFLELAYEAPLRSLKKPVDTDDQEDRNTEYYIADRVCLAASTLLGGRYAEVARKCVQCDFGRGSDLNALGLQLALHQEVVEELEGLEDKLRAVDIDE